jgi:hypothetical protein
MPEGNGIQTDDHHTIEFPLYNTVKRSLVFDLKLKCMRGNIFPSYHLHVRGLETGHLFSHMFPIDYYLVWTNPFLEALVCLLTYTFRLRLNQDFEEKRCRDGGNVSGDVLNLLVM